MAISHYAKAFDLHFILNRAIVLKRRPDLIMNGQKIMGMDFEHIKFIDISFIPFPLHKLTVAFGLSVSKSWHPHYSNTKENLNYIVPILDISYCCADEMNDAERREFLEWYEGQNVAVFATSMCWNHAARMTSQF